MQIIANHPYITFYIIYSIIGYYYLATYLARCVYAKVPGFAGSLTATILMALLCGAITTGFLIYSFFQALVMVFNEWRGAPDKDQDDHIL